jgi:hypothetical protein
VGHDRRDDCRSDVVRLWNPLLVVAAESDMSKAPFSIFVEVLRGPTMHSSIAPLVDKAFLVMPRSRPITNSQPTTTRPQVEINGLL